MFSSYVFGVQKISRNRLLKQYSDLQDRPGKFLLSYLPRNHFRHEYVTVTPEGYRYRGQLFETLKGLLKWFKEHFRDPIPGTGTVGANTPRTVINPHFPITPMMSKSE